jgi:NAD(P)-dependent dehydrogenase (short-subunit alcohol dehydrogenase family)
MAGRRGFAGIAHYSASKWGVIGLIKSAALEVAGNGITVNAICPATVETEMLAGIKRSDPCTPASNPIPVRSMTSDVVTRTMLHIVTDPGFITGCTFELGLGTSAMMP